MNTHIDMYDVHSLAPRHLRVSHKKCPRGLPYFILLLSPQGESALRNNSRCIHATQLPGGTPYAEDGREIKKSHFFVLLYLLFNMHAKDEAKGVYFLSAHRSCIDILISF